MGLRAEENRTKENAQAGGVLNPEAFRFKFKILIFCHFYGALRQGAYRLVLDTQAKAA